jgi:hypothetical protein
MAYVLGEKYLVDQMQLSHNASHRFQHCLAHIVDSASAVIAHVEAEARGGRRDGGQLTSWILRTNQLLRSEAGPQLIQFFIHHQYVGPHPLAGDVQRAEQDNPQAQICYLLRI